MKSAIRILGVLLALLSAAAGAAKVMLVPEELEFLTGFGFSELAIVVYGGIQIVGGILLVCPVSAAVGGIVVLVAFAISTVLLILDGDLTFASVSLLPVVLAGFVVSKSRRNREGPSLR